MARVLPASQGFLVLRYARGILDERRDSFLADVSAWCREQPEPISDDSLGRQLALVAYKYMGR